MSGTALSLVVFAAAVVSGLVAGVFFAFSNFVMAGLGRIPADHAIVAMRSINVTAINPLFMTILFGAGVLCAFLIVATLQDIAPTTAKLVLIGASVYITGCIFVTIFGNVPLNEALAGVAPGTPETARLWDQYLTSWTMWNHVRTASALATAMLLGAAGRY